MENVQVLLARDPDGRQVEAADMEVVRRPFSIPDPLEPGALVLCNLYFSLDPYMRGRMNTTRKSYFPPFQIGSVLETRSVAEVIAGSRPEGGIATGDKVVCYSVGWETYSVVPPGGFMQRVDPSLPFSPTLFLGLLGITGATARHGLDICDIKPGQTIFISAAAGAVGLAAGQMAKLKGLRVIGSAGSDEKVRLLTEKFGFNAAFNYKTALASAEGIEGKLRELAPDGIDSYFDNVGSEHLDAAIGCLKQKGRVAACGMISNYNGKPATLKNLVMVVFKELLVQGFLITEQLRNPVWMDGFMKETSASVVEGTLVDPEHVVEGIENTPEAFVGLFTGANTGKLLIKV